MSEQESSQTPHTSPTFRQRDRDNIVALLNFIHTHARYSLTTAQVIELFGLLSWAQKELIPRIDANIMELIARHPPPPEKQAKSRK